MQNDCRCALCQVPDALGEFWLHTRVGSWPICERCQVASTNLLSSLDAEFYHAQMWGNGERLPCLNPYVQTRETPLEPQTQQELNEAAAVLNMLEDIFATAVGRGEHGAVSACINDMGWITAIHRQQVSPKTEAAMLELIAAIREERALKDKISIDQAVLVISEEDLNEMGKFTDA